MSNDSEKSRPLLSIVIANYNYGRFIEDAILSVFSQVEKSKSLTFSDVEIIVCDAASTDDSVKIIRKHADDLPQQCARVAGTSSDSLITWWCSEPDGGQSAAFNKGFAHAHGRFLTWLNADDVLLPGTIERLKAAAECWPECEWFVGGSFWLDKGLRVLKCFRARGFSEIRMRTGQVSSWGPSSFFSKRLLESVGGVDERCKYTMDGDLWLKFSVVAGARYRPFIDYAWGLRLHEDAKMSAHNFASSGQAAPEHPKWRQIAFEGEIRKEYFTPTAKRNRWNWFRTIRWFSVLKGRFDTMRFRGRYYGECF